MAQCLARSQTFSQFIRLSSLLSYTSKSKTDCVLKYYLESNDHQRNECNASSSEVLGAIGTRSFGKPYKCIHKSQLGCWKSSSDQSFDSITATNERSKEWTQQTIFSYLTYGRPRPKAMRILTPNRTLYLAHWSDKLHLNMKCRDWSWRAYTHF